MRAADSLSFLLASQTKKLSPPGSVGWAERAWERCGRSCYGNVPTELLSECSCYRLVASVIVRLGRVIWTANLGLDRRGTFMGCTARVPSSIVCTVRGRGCSPCFLLLRLRFHYFDRGCQRGKNLNQAAPGCVVPQRKNTRWTGSTPIHVGFVLVPRTNSFKPLIFVVFFKRKKNVEIGIFYYVACLGWLHS